VNSPTAILSVAVDGPIGEVKINISTFGGLTTAKNVHETPVDPVRVVRTYRVAGEEFRTAAKVATLR